MKWRRSAPALIGLLVLATVVALARACAAEPTADSARTGESILLRRELGVMGTDLVIEVLGEDEAKLEAAIEAAVIEIQRIEDLMTDWRSSPLMDLNDAAGAGPRAVPPELAKLIGRAQAIGDLTEGAFDITYAGVGKLWDFKADPPLVPDEEAITAALERVGYDRVTVDLESSSVTLPAGMRIGLGGIAKGYGVDRAMQVLMDRGVRNAMVNAGGDLKALGRKSEELWQVAIRHPRERERVMAVLPVSNTCVVTSGDYERFFEIDGVRYHHILDPRTGRPSTGSISATVVAPDAAFADSLATAMTVLGPERGMAILESLERVEGILVGMDGEVHLSSGLSDVVRDERPDATAAIAVPGQ